MERSHPPSAIWTPDKPVVERGSPGNWRCLVDSQEAHMARAIFTTMERALWISPKVGPLVRLEFNPIQMILALMVAGYWAARIPIRLMIPKFRQGGVTTWFFGLLFARCLFAVSRREPYRVGVVSHEEDGGEEIFRMFHTFLRNLPPELNPESNPDYKLDHENSSQITWRAGPQIQIYSVKKLDSLGRGGTLNALHCTEVGSYADKGVDPRKAMKAITGCLVDGPTLICSFESTAKGHDPFFWPIVEASIKKASDYRTIFLPWPLDKNYTLSWADYRKACMANEWDPGVNFVETAEEAALRERLSQPVPRSDRHFRYELRLTDEQLIWRRSKIRDFEAKNPGGGLADFRHEFPSTFEEAFEASESCYFAQEVIRHYALQIKPPETRGSITMAQPSKITEWDEHPNGEWVCWSEGTASKPGEPVPGESYTIVADVSEGEARDADYTDMRVFRDKDLRLVARARSNKLKWEESAALMEAAGYYWNKALLVPEVNQNKNFLAGRMVAETLFKVGYPNLYFYQEEEQLNPTAPSKPGWLTHEGNRSKALKSMAQACRSKRLISHDEVMVSEMRTFVWNDKPGKRRYEASAGRNDDSIMCTAIACAVLPPDGVRRRLGVQEPDDSPVARAIRYWEELAAAEDRGIDTGEAVQF